MIIPLGTDRPLRRPTVTTYALIGLCVAAYVVQIATRAGDDIGWFTRWGMLWPPRGFGLDRWATLVPPYFRWWQPITYQFLHSPSDWKHLAGNMLFLYVFGPNIEDRLGRLWFLMFYLVGGVAAAAMQLAFSANPLVGASGSIAACTGAYLVMFPRTRIKTLFLLMPGSITIVSAWWFIAFSIGWDVFNSMFSGSRMSLIDAVGGGGPPAHEVRDRVAHLAHMGGYLYGAAVALALLWLRVVPREPYDLFTMGRQAYRRRQFKAAGAESRERVRQHWQRAKTNPHAQEEADTLSAARADIVAKINAQDLAGAGAAYKRLADQYANFIGGTTLSRRYQYDLGNHFYQTKDHAAAVYAYERFLETYPRDPEAGHIRLLLGLILARSLNDPVRAKSLISEALPHLEGGEADLARRELQALG